MSEHAGDDEVVERLRELAEENRESEEACNHAEAVAHYRGRAQGFEEAIEVLES